ncbi:NAD(P)/FAD-dependent oxidoreductase [Collinsella vaginalis]|uniref:NAD(P)/FAD-dependent oxidoreductase n=1 Tax=Collinsella vaginalis TaxID=1870987 RepID=UPI000A26AFC9|nr:FAD-dependent oxidoreductase [Collinsella vaginalis]
MIEVSNIRVPLGRGGSEESLLAAARDDALRTLGLPASSLSQIELHRVSVDARRKSDVHFTVSVHLALTDPRAEQIAVAALPDRDARRVRLAEKNAPTWPRPAATTALPTTAHLRPVVVGAGCAGLFAALTLAEAGLEPLLIERGDDAERRTGAVERFNAVGDLDPESNIQFGLGGAGTFSDGKLTTGTKNPAHRLILETLVDGGAPREILWEAKPHVGSDILPSVVTHIVARIRARGGEVRFRCRLVDIERDRGGAIAGIRLQTASGEERVACRDLVLACGHSARDVFELLRDRGVTLARKTFAMGARVEHLQADIDRSQYGSAAGHPALGTAPYKLVAHTDTGRSLFTFCMCPGGEVVAAASEPGGVVTNGASLHARAGRNANAALLVNVNPQDLPGDDPLAGVELQRACERRAFELGGGVFRAPAQLVGGFLAGVPSTGAGAVEPTYPRGVAWGSVEEALPVYIVDAMRHGLPELARRLRAFGAPDAVLTGVESRSSSPISVPRGADCASVSTPGLFPCGEGAGYAGGIMSAATDGIRVATAIIERR